MKFAYFVSSHGLGHATRAIAVMQALQKQDPATEFEVFGRLPEFLLEAAQLTKCRLHQLDIDPGVLQRSTFILDEAGSLARLADFVQSYPGLCSQVQSLCRDIDAVVSDVAMLGLEVAKRLKRPSVLIENFTWDWIYQELASDIPEFGAYAAWFEERYAHCDLHIQVEPRCRPKPGAITFGPLARELSRSAAASRQMLGISPDEQVILFSFAEQEAERFVAQEWTTSYTCVLPSTRQELQRIDNRVYVPRHLCHQDLVALSDLVLAKLGYSTIAEIALAGGRLAFLSRRWFPESAVLEDYVSAQLTSVALADDWTDAEELIAAVLRQDRKPSLGSSACSLGQLLCQHVRR